MKGGVKWHLVLGWSLMVFLFLQQKVVGQSDQFLDKIKLHNGNVIWGKVEFQDETVKILLSQKDSISVPISMIKSLKTQKLNPELYLKRSQGAYYQVTLGVLLGKGHQNLENTGSFSASFTSGYKFKPLVGVGLGIGLNYYSEQIHVPVYLDIQGDLLEGRITPFYELGAGWSWAEDRESVYDIEKVKGGFFFKPSLGVRWHFPKYSWIFQLSYVRQNSITHFEPLDFGNGNVITNVENRTFNRMGISIGVSF